jgi:hypothetical protein
MLDCLQTCLAEHRLITEQLAEVLLSDRAAGTLQSEGSFISISPTNSVAVGELRIAVSRSAVSSDVRKRNGPLRFRRWR